MHAGDTEYATHDLGSYLFSSFISGRNLVAVEEDFQIYVHIVESFKNAEQSAWVRVYWQ
jgi:hypothetical protein